MNANDNQVDISVFLVGKHVYLRPPDIEKDVKNGRWFSWFNDPKVTRYLEQGVFPNTLEKQIEYAESLKNDPTRVILCIIDKNDNRHIGVISLSSINFINRTATSAIVMGERDFPPEAPLEAEALMTEYGFDRLNLNKIWARQCVGLWKWTNTLELIGFRIEGYCEAIRIRDGEIQDAVYISITADRFYKLRKERKGNICTENILGLLNQRRKENITGKVKAFFDELYSK